jgi:hypothetical protein
MFSGSGDNNIKVIYLFVAGGRTLNLFLHSGMTPRRLKDKKTYVRVDEHKLK